jgi:hypothetical protein
VKIWSRTMMRFWAALGLVFVMAACEPKKPTPPPVNKPVDRSDARATAVAILKAYQTRDLQALAEFCEEENRQLLKEIAEQGESNPRYHSLFVGWRWEAVSTWNGQIKEVRYRVYSPPNGKKSIKAIAYFADLGPDGIAVVTMKLVDGKWMFEDIHRNDRSDFEKDALTLKVK